MHMRVRGTAGNGRGEGAPLKYSGFSPAMKPLTLSGMKMRPLVYLAVLLIAAASPTSAQDVPEMPKPTKEHEWLKRFVGDWDNEVQIFMGGPEPMTLASKEKARMIGGFWVIGESVGSFGDMPFTNITTFGYDPEKKKYIGMAVDSASSTLWQYEGTVDSSGKTMTFETEGPCPMRAGQMTKFKGVTEFKSEDERVFTSSFLGEDGKWVVNAIVTSKRKK